MDVSKFLPVCLGLVTVLVLCGCLSTNPGKAKRMISHWIPVGTPQEEAIRILKRRGFEYGKAEWHSDVETVYWFSRETKILKNMCWFDVHFRDGKVSSIEDLGAGNGLFIPVGERAVR